MSANINYLSILLSAVVAWFFGAAYYGTLAKPWVAALGKTMEEFKQEQAAKVGRIGGMVPFVLSFFAELVMAWVLYGIMVHLKLFTLRAGMISGAFIWFGFVLTTMAVNNAYTWRKPMLTVIDAAHWLGVLLIMGAIIGGMGQ